MAHFLLLSAMFILVSCSAQNHADRSAHASFVDSGTNTDHSVAAALPAQITASRETAITQAVQRCQAAIVGVNVLAVRSVIRSLVPREFQDLFPAPWFGFRDWMEVESVGSGFLISEDGYILTNAHVVENATKVVITMTDGTKHQAEIVGVDPVTDIAVLKIDGEALPYLEFGDSQDLLTGEWVIAFGNPFGLFAYNAKPTVTVGVISNQHLNFIIDGKVYRDMIQTDAAISSGNSGGPLTNALGEVIGMNTFIYSTAQRGGEAGSIGIGFAIPAHRLQRITELLIAQQKIPRPDPRRFGLQLRNLTTRLKRQLDLPEEIQGVLITGIRRGSLADRAGLDAGDLILQIDGEPTWQTTDVYVHLLDAISGDVLRFTILRDGKRIEQTMEIP